ncbi:MAG TPA: hypothetical protein VF695_07385 [Sphingomonas sp.]|jgi:hypothetical protein
MFLIDSGITLAASRSSWAGMKPKSQANRWTAAGNAAEYLGAGDNDHEVFSCKREERDYGLPHQAARDQPSTGARRKAVEAAPRRPDPRNVGHGESPQLRDRIALQYQQ